MSKLRNANDQTVTQRFNELSDADDCISADTLTDLIAEFTERELSSKTVRARLRAMQYRDQAQFKNARWRIDKATAESEIEHYASKVAKAN